MGSETIRRAILNGTAQTRRNIIKEFRFQMDTRGFEEDNIKGRSTEIFMSKRVERNGKLLLRRSKANRYNYHDKDEHNTEKEMLNKFVKQLQTN